MTGPEVLTLVIVVVCAVGLTLIVIAPWKRVRAEPPLDDEVETRLLLGEDPDEVAASEPEPLPRPARLPQRHHES